MESPLLLARNVAMMFQNLNLGHHEKLYEFIGAAAVTFTKLANDPAAYEEFQKEQFWADCGKTPKGACSSTDLLIYLTGATTRDARRQAGKYARAIDYMIAKKINDYEAYLKRTGYENILEAARSEKPKGRVKEKPKGGAKVEAWPFLKVYIHPREFATLELILRNCPAEVAFELFCRAEPGHDVIVTANRTPISKVDQFPETELELKEYRKRHTKMVVAEKKLSKEAELLSSSKENAKAGARQ